MEKLNQKGSEEKSQETLRRIAKMSPGERRKRGIFPCSRDLYACSSSYDYTNAYAFANEYTIGRDC